MTGVPLPFISYGGSSYFYSFELLLVFASNWKEGGKQMKYFKRHEVNLCTDSTGFFLLFLLSIAGSIWCQCAGWH